MQRKFILKLLVVILSLILFINCSNGDEEDTKSNVPKVSDIRTFGGTKNESAQSIIKTIDGGYVILGFTQSMDGDIMDKTDESFDYWLLKFDSNNELQWQKTYGGSLDDKGSDLIQTMDDGYAIFGSSKSSDGDLNENAGDNDFWMAKLDVSGNIEWQKSYGFSGLDTGTTIIATSDNGYLLAGVLDVTASGGLGNSKSITSKQHAGGDYWLIKLSASGTTEWSRYFGGTFTDTPNNVVQTEDNGYLVVGSSDSEDVDIKSPKGSYDFWVVKVSETGTLEWEQSYGGSEIDEAWAIEHSGDGNYLIVGGTRSTDDQVEMNNGAADIWIIKITSNGDLLWEKTFGGQSFDAARSIAPTIDGKFLICGNSRSANGDLSVNNGQNDAWILKIDSNANLEWQKSIGGSEIDLSFDIVQLYNSDIIVAGESNSSDMGIPENKGFTDLLIINLDE